ncbi:MAG: winged helix-turn-helix domain-containing protein [Candidatus Bathyarchaeia archaeon]|nr:hypothetical protein [Candidatus Bathyarchaeota archaeon]
MDLLFDALGSGRRRSRLEIYLDILEAVERGINKPTRIMFAVNLSWKPFRDMLLNLEKWGLIERRVVKNHELIFITEKGKRILGNLKALSMEFAASKKLKTRIQT